MRTRSQLKREEEEEEEEEAAGARGSVSRKASGTKGRRRDKHPSKDGRKQATEGFPREKGKERANEELSLDLGVKECSGKNAGGSTAFRGEGVERSIHCDGNEMDWEDGAISVSELEAGHHESLRTGVTIEFTESPSSAHRKPSRRASAEEKESAELLHKVHLLCLLARGRLVNRACDDPLIQAFLLSLLPSYLLKIADAPKLTASQLGSLVNWFCNNFHIRSQNNDRGSFKSNLSFALETHEGTAEEVAALSVALFRVLNLTTRFVSIMDVASLKPDVDQSGCLNQDAPRLDTKIASSSQLPVPHHIGSSLNNRNINKDQAHEFSESGKCHKPESNSCCKKNLLKGLAVGDTADDHISESEALAICSGVKDSCVMNTAEGSKRKGDLEFELQLAMALSATAAGIHNDLGSKSDDLCDTSSPLSPFKRMRKSKTEESAVMDSGNTSAVWSRRTGPPLYWAEVYCSGETLTGRWVHVDAANGIVDGEEKVESAAAACRRPLKYVVAFAGNGAKDVTRRYCMHWYKIASQRINLQWWDSVMAPLKELESGATGGIVRLEASPENSSCTPGENVLNNNLCEMDFGGSKENSATQETNIAGGHGTESCKKLNKAENREPSAQYPGIASRDSLEDMELETRALTEPLPTNQQAYKNHHLYVIERWLTMHQVLHPKGPILGYCSGLPVYPRFCVQTVQTKHKWLREGLQVKTGEVPAKIVKRSKKFGKTQMSEPSASEEAAQMTVELYGRWQMEQLNLPHAVNGIVPKNERGQVDVWSEKCLPPGTVHLRLPRLVPVAKRLEIDFAPAMVGFEFRNGRSVPIFEGIVVCAEFKDALLEAYGEEEERREAEEKMRNEAQALSRWFQLLASIVTRQRLKNSYMDDTSSSSIRQNPPNNRENDAVIAQTNSCEDAKQSGGPEAGSIQDVMPALPSAHDHEHIYPLENQSFDEENFVRTKRCPCGFSIQVEEL